MIFSQRQHDMQARQAEDGQELTLLYMIFYEWRVLMSSSLSEERRQLLVQLESLIGNEYYSRHIQNYGPGGVRSADGRSFRYPITFRKACGEKVKVNTATVPETISSEVLRSGYYALGANQLDVMKGLERILHYLERHHGLIIEAHNQD